MNTHKQMAEYYQAMADGKDLQFIRGGHMIGDWINSPTDPVDALSLHIAYRIKPQPEVIYFNKLNSGEMHFYKSKEDAVRYSVNFVCSYIAKRFIAEE